MGRGTLGLGEWEVGSGKWLVGERDSSGRSFDWGIWSKKLMSFKVWIVI